MRAGAERPRRGTGRRPEGLDIAPARTDCNGMTDANEKTVPLGAARGGRCPMCGRPTRPETRPFCSRRCADIDLARWLGGVYRIPAAEQPDATPGQNPDAERD